MEVQPIVSRLPRKLRRHRVVRALIRLTRSDTLQRIRFNGDAEAVVDVTDGDSRTVLIVEQYDPEFFDIARAFLKPNSVYFDVGANYGLCSFGLMPTCPDVRYHLFEANPRIWPCLRRSVALHQRSHVQIVEAAVGEREGVTMINDVNAYNNIGAGFIVEQGGTSTRMTTLGEYMRAGQIERSDFTKMDIEGYELFAMRGAQTEIAAGKLPVVYFELKQPLVARFGKSVFSVLEAFRSMGYRLFHVRQQDFAKVKPKEWSSVAGLRAALVDDFPIDLWTDLLAVHESASEVRVERLNGS